MKEYTAKELYTMAMAGMTLDDIKKMTFDAKFPQEKFENAVNQLKYLDELEKRKKELITDENMTKLQKRIELGEEKLYSQTTPERLKIIESEIIKLDSELKDINDLIDECSQIYMNKKK